MGGLLSDRGGLCIHTWRIHNRNTQDTHTQNCTMFDRAVLRCLSADQAVEEETARGFLAYPWFEGISNLHVLRQEGKAEIMCLWVCLGWGFQMQHSFKNSIVCCCLEN